MPFWRHGFAPPPATSARVRVLVVIDPADQVAIKSFRNLGRVHVCAPRELNAYDVLVADVVVFAKSTLPSTAPAATDAGESA